MLASNYTARSILWEGAPARDDVVIFANVVSELTLPPTGELRPECWTPVHYPRLFASMLTPTVWCGFTHKKRPPEGSL